MAFCDTSETEKKRFLLLLFCKILSCAIQHHYRPVALPFEIHFYFYFSFCSFVYLGCFCIRLQLSQYFARQPLLFSTLFPLLGLFSLLHCVSKDASILYLQLIYPEEDCSSCWLTKTDNLSLMTQQLKFFPVRTYGCFNCEQFAAVDWKSSPYSLS